MKSIGTEFVSLRHLHPDLAWTLVDGLYQQCVVPEHAASDNFNGTIGAVRANRAEFPRAQAAARRLFVYADSVVLPNEIDVSGMTKSLFADQHLNWVHDVIPADQMNDLEPSND